jgi:predicted phage tail protein
MTSIHLHGILAQEYGGKFNFSVSKPKDALKAIDANREGFIARIMELQREGFVYDLILDKRRVTNVHELDINNVGRIDIVPAIMGSGFIGAALGWVFGGSLLANIVLAVGLAALQYALTPKPDLGMPDAQNLSAEASAMKSSYIFSTNLNTAQQGTPVPLGYGRLRVGSAVIQTSIKSFPTIKKASQIQTKDGKRTTASSWSNDNQTASNFRN